jgi:hypothetical protein
MTKAQVLLAAIGANDKLDQAVMIWATNDRTWPRMYRILEEVEAYLGASVSKSGFCTVEARRRFKHSAQPPLSAGDDARPLAGTDPPANPMSFDEAVAFINGIILSALERAVVESVGGT